MSDKSYPSWEQPEIRVRVTDKLKTELENIADHQGDTLANFLRPILREISDGYPAEMKLPVKKD